MVLSGSCIIPQGKGKHTPTRAIDPQALTIELPKQENGRSVKEIGHGKIQIGRQYQENGMS
jgi:hypothetical protein